MVTTDFSLTRTKLNPQLYAIPKIKFLMDKNLNTKMKLGHLGGSVS